MTLIERVGTLIKYTAPGFQSFVRIRMGDIYETIGLGDFECASFQNGDSVKILFGADHHILAVWKNEGPSGWMDLDDFLDQSAVVQQYSGDGRIRITRPDVLDQEAIRRKHMEKIYGKGETT